MKSSSCSVLVHTARKSSSSLDSSNTESKQMNLGTGDAYGLITKINIFLGNNVILS